MKIIHTADWHIGKIVHEHSMIEEQEYILKQFIRIVDEEKPHGIILAGDIYDRSVAPTEAIELLDRVLGTIVLDMGIPILAVAGNHDSPERLSFGSGIMKDRNLHIEGVFKEDLNKVVLQDEYGAVNFFMLPYADPAIVRNTYEDKSIRNHDQALKAIMGKIGKVLDRTERNILITHGYIRGLEALEDSDSERPLSIGGTDYANVEYLKDFDYVALGHLHRPQRVGSDNVRYSGSLLKYSFSEVRHKKSITIVNMDSTGDIEVEERELIPKRDMIEIEGSLDELLNSYRYEDEDLNHFYRVILTDKGELIDPMAKLRGVYPNVLQIEIKDRMRDTKPGTTSAGRGYQNKTKLQLFKEFYSNINDVELGEDDIKIIERIIGEVEKRGDDIYEAY